MPGMEMPGGWTMSMAWMRMPGQSWPGAAATFIGMWSVMMVAMMLPVLVPMLMRYAQATGAASTSRLGWLTTVVATGYFLVWMAPGVAAYQGGLAMAEIAMALPAVTAAVPLAAGLVVVLAGWLQLSAWKAKQLACCRTAHAPQLRGDASTAFRHGLRLAIQCVRCCAAPTVILLVIGVMDLRAMAIVGAAITAERLAPAGERIARALGAVVVVTGIVLIARAAG